MLSKASRAFRASKAIWHSIECVHNLNFGLNQFKQHLSKPFHSHRICDKWKIDLWKFDVCLMTFRWYCAFPIYVIARNKRMLTSRQSTFQPLTSWETFWHLIFEPICLHKLLDDYKCSFISNRGYRELLHGRLCRPDSKVRPLVCNFTNVANSYSKIVLPQLHPYCKCYDFFVSTISYRPTDLSLLKEFSKNVNFWKSYIFLKILPNRGHWLAILLLWL